MTQVPYTTGSGSLYAGLEAGGTKCVCAVGTGPDDLRACLQLATTTPSETLAQAVAFFEAYRSGLMALGIASFGPLDPRPHSASLALLPQRQSQAGPILTWRGRSAVPYVSQ
jgi:predicted NBD/HSP70 family sugar kinase